MFVRHHELVWMLRQIEGQRIHKDKLIRKFTNHGIYSFLPRYERIESLFDGTVDKRDVAKSLIRALEARVNQQLDFPAACLETISYLEFKRLLSQLITQQLQRETTAGLRIGVRVSVRQDCAASNVRPGSEGFVIEKFPAAAKVRFYSIAGRYGLDTLSMEVPDGDLQVLGVAELLKRHQDLEGIAHFFIDDSILRALKASLDGSAYAFAAQRAIEYLVAEGFAKIDGDELVSVPERIFSILAPQLDKTYRDSRLFSSQSLSSPPSERKPHVLRLELTTGCDYNRCTFCSEYAQMAPVTKSIAEFTEHVDRVADSIGSEKSRIQRLFIGSGNSLGVDTGLLLEALGYAGAVFNPQRISLYGRTASILEKTVDDLKRLKAAGLSMIYWGLESGSDEVLSYVCKDCTRNDMIEAARMLAAAEIDVSGMLMPGVGGLRLADAHVAGTLDLLHNIELAYLTLLSINPSETSLYARQMRTENDNRPLTPAEVNAQVYRLLQGLRPTGLQIGMFTEEVDQVSSNTLRFNYQFTEANKELLLRDFCGEGTRF